MELRKVLVLWGILLGLVCFATNISAHEIAGEVTPQMTHMKRAVLLIQDGKEKDAIREIRNVYEEFTHDMGMGMVMKGPGLKETARSIDSRYKTVVGPMLSTALSKEDGPALLNVIQSLAYLLMLEKFETLQSTIEKKSSGPENQKTIFNLGRNYYSYLLEPILVRKDPLESARLDRLLDSMQTRLNERAYPEFERMIGELERAIEASFPLLRPESMRSGATP